jgi:molecular chaperone DnaK (HSP70)
VWAIDLGTTNTGVSRWDAEAHRPRLLELPDICRNPGGEDHLEAPRLVPSATHVIEERSFGARVAGWPFFAKRAFWGEWGFIGRSALDRNEAKHTPSFAPSFKHALGQAPFRILARAGKRTFTARDVARIFIRELLAEVKRATGERIRDLVITTPVESFESYRAELVQAFKKFGVKRIRFVDEPVAAAVGYGLSMKQNRVVLVVDFGGGTLDLALVRMTARGMREGHCEVLAKEGRDIGGNLVDAWLLHEFCDRLDYPLVDHKKDESKRFWYQMMLNEARRVKESVFFEDEVFFSVTPPDELRNFEARIHGDTPDLPVTKALMTEILETNGLYRGLRDCMDGIVEQGVRIGIDMDSVDDVLMVGGSTLLPGVYQFFEEKFTRGRVRAWQPFEAVAFGACAFAADQFQQSDFIVHDYAFVTHNAKTHDPEYTVIVPKGTRIPTAPDFWKRQLVPTCSLGEPETMFKLVISEIGRADEDMRKFGWDEDGGLKKIKGDEKLVVPLNDKNPTLGYLDPPHSPRDRSPRLEISFGVNDDRWLHATVLDLKTRKKLMNDQAVVQLL